MRLVLPAVLRVILLAFLVVSSAAILYATVMNERTVESLADQSLESTALALSSATESALRAGGGGSESEVQGILSDRVVAVITSYSIHYTKLYDIPRQRVTIIVSSKTFYRTPR